MSDTLKDVIWMSSSKKEVRSFPDLVKDRIGYALHLVQIGEDPPDFKPVPSLGKGVLELRVSDDSEAYRVLYVAKFEEAIYVLHGFHKKSARGISTPKQHAEIARARYKDLLAYRRQLEEQRR